MRFFIYGRKSVFTGKGESVENQIEMCREYIASRFAEDAEREIRIYEDEGFSAKNTDRPGSSRKCCAISGKSVRNTSFAIVWTESAAA